MASVSLLVALAATTACCPDSVVDEIYLIRAPSSDLDALIAACRNEGGNACLPLCRRVTGVDRDFAHCELHPNSHGYTQVHVGYHEVLVCE